MTGERYRQMRDIVDAALERPRRRREEFLRAACKDDDDLLIEVGQYLVAIEEPERWIDLGFAALRMSGWNTVISPRCRLEGRTIDGYEILRRLGEGRTFDTYLAHAIDAGTAVAIKLLRQEVVGSEASLPDVQPLRALQHRVIVSPLATGATSVWTLKLTCCPEHPDLASDHATPYVVTSYVSGQPIDAYWRWHNWSLKPDVRLDMFRQICQAIQLAHDHGIVHGSLSAGNIVVTAGGEVRILDAGLAALFERWRSPPRMSSVFGEKWRPGATPQDDVYDLGVVFYRLSTGQHPFPPVTQAALPSLAIRQARSDDVNEAWRQLVEQTTLDRALSRALSPHVEERQSCADELMHDLTVGTG